MIVNSLIRNNLLFRSVVNSPDKILLAVRRSFFSFEHQENLTEKLFFRAIPYFPSELTKATLHFSSRFFGDSSFYQKEVPKESSILTRALFLDLAEKKPLFLVENIRNYSYIDEQTRKAVALLLAEKYPVEVVSNIGDFGITDQVFLKTYLCSLMKVIPFTVVDRIRDFKIEDPKFFEEFIYAMIGLAPYAQKLGFGKQEHFQDFKALPRCILNLDIIDKEILGRIIIALAEKDLDHDGKELLKSIVSMLMRKEGTGYLCYLMDQKLLKEVVISLVRKVPEFFLSCIHINGFHFTDQTAYQDLGIALAEESPDYLISYVEKCEITSREMLKIFTLNLLQKNPVFFKNIAEKWKLTREERTSILEEYRKLLSLRKSNVFLDYELEKIFSQVAKYKSPIANSLLAVLCKEITDFAYQNVYKDLLLNSKKEDLVAHKVFPAIIPAKWIYLAKNQGSEEIQILQEFLSHPEIKASIRDRRTGAFMSSLLSLILDIEKDESMNPLEKLTILAKVCDLRKDLVISIPDLIESFALLSFFCQKNRGFNFNYVFSRSALKELSLAWEKDLEKNIQVDLTGIDNLRERYKATFGSSHIPGSLQTYARGLISLLKEKEFSQNYTTFVRSVLLGKEACRKERYNLSSNLHLQKIAETPEIFHKWKESLASITMDREDKKYTIRDVDDALEIFEIPTITGFSCQSIYAQNFNLNKCLIGYSMDGSMRMITVEDASGALLARSVLRILLDENFKPILLLEKLYNKERGKNFQEFILEMARQKTRYLGLELLREASFPLSRKVYWLGGDYCIYSDTLGGVIDGRKEPFFITIGQD